MTPTQGARSLGLLAALCLAGGCVQWGTRNANEWLTNMPGELATREAHGEASLADYETINADIETIDARLGLAEGEGRTVVVARLGGDRQTGSDLRPFARAELDDVAEVLRVALCRLRVHEEDIEWIDRQESEVVLKAEAAVFWSSREKSTKKTDALGRAATKTVELYRPRFESIDARANQALETWSEDDPKPLSCSAEDEGSYSLATETSWAEIRRNARGMSREARKMKRRSERSDDP